MIALRRQDWDNILRPCTSGMISKMGFNSHTSRAIVFGPRRYGGIGLVHGYAKQGSERISHLLTHLRNKTQVGKQLLNTLSHLQLFSGQAENLLEVPQPMPQKKRRKGHNLYSLYHLGQGWLLSLRHFLFTINARIVIKDAWKPPLVREHDIAIMDAFRERCSPSEYELAMANSVRLHLRVITSSDVIDVNGG